MEEVGSSSSGSNRFDPRQQRYTTLEEIMELSPSRKDGIEWPKEEQYRMRSGLYILKLGQKLEQSPQSIATAVYFFHKFYLLQSLANNAPWIIAVACLLRASKAEHDVPCTLNEAAFHSYWIAYKKPPENKEIFMEHRRLIILGERTVLETLPTFPFIFGILHPRDLLQKYVADLNIESPDSREALLQAARNFANHMHLTTLCLQFSARRIAGGLIFLGLKCLKLKPQNATESFWRTQFDVTTPQLEAIISQLLQFREIFRKPGEFGGNVGAEGGEGDAAEDPATNAGQEREPNPSSSKGKEVVGEQ